MTHTYDGLCRVLLYVVREPVELANNRTDEVIDPINGVS